MRCVECGQYKDSQGHAQGCWTTNPKKILGMMVEALRSEQGGIDIDGWWSRFDGVVEGCDVAAAIAYGVGEGVLRLGWDFVVELNGNR